ncbi:hypothetical protein Leryth_024376 [Lithospermum erythrorhizon]|nr:hypothetical protein Leryth_024376 [Lithospermum erythrorhizon]
MQAPSFPKTSNTPSNNFQNKLSPPQKLPTLHGNNISLVQSTSVPIPRAISITAPTHHEIPNLDVEIDDNVTAYWDYQFLFMSQRSETDVPVSLRVVEGSIPSDFPIGTYFLTGPGMFADDHGSTVHPLDGHGYLRSFTIDSVTREVKFMARYIKTEAQVEERDPETGQWRFTHRGPFSVLKGGKMVGNTKVMKNVANTSVVKWGGKLLCLWEGGSPYEIESMSLDTVGTVNIMDDEYGSSKSLPADDHHHKETSSGGFWEVAAQVLKPMLYEDMLLPRSNFTFYEFDSNFKLVESQEFNIPDHLMIHDWAFTDNHYILFGNRIKLDVGGSMAAVCGLSPMISALSVNPSKPTSPIYLLPRFNNSHEKRDWKVPIEAPSQLWVLHVGNAFEAKNEKTGDSDIQIQASGCSYEWFNFQKMFGYDWKSGKLDPSMMNVNDKLLPHLVKISVKLDSEGSCKKCNVNDLGQWSKASDFPVINQDYCGRKNTYTYASTSSGSRQALPNFPFDTVVKINSTNKSVSTWSTGRRRFIGEPIFIPRGNGKEDDGYLLVVEYAVSTQRCYLVILDAKLIGENSALVAS